MSQAPSGAELKGRDEFPSDVHLGHFPFASLFAVVVVVVVVVVVNRVVSSTTGRNSNSNWRYRRRHDRH